MNNIDFPLDHEQTEKILQFQDRTGIEDIALCRDVLQRHNWDLDTTIQDQLNIKEGRPSVNSVSRPARDKLPVLHNDPSVLQVFVAESPALPFRGRWTGTVELIALFLFRFLYNTFGSFFEFAGCFFWNRPRYRYPLSEWLETAYTYYMHRTNALKAFTRAATKYAVMFFILVFYATLSITEGCSSRSTPKPRPAGPTPRPNITFHTYACPPEYATVYCLNGATCFTVKIGEHLLYNCECAEGFMGPRCEFKDLDSSYLLSRKHILLETASIAFGATLAIFLVVIVCIFLYIRYHRRQKQINTKIYMY